MLCISLYNVVLSRVSQAKIRKVYRDPVYNQTAAKIASFFGSSDNVNEVDKTTTGEVDDILLHR
jgi:hypothetical protein